MVDSARLYDGEDSGRHARLCQRLERLCEALELARLLGESALARWVFDLHVNID